MAESQKYYLGDTVIYKQYLGNNIMIASIDLPAVPEIPTDTLLVWLDAENGNSWTPGGSVWTDIQGNHNITLSGGYTSGSTPQQFIDFDGTSGKGTFSPQIILGQFTMITWFRMDGTSLNTVIGDSDELQTAQPKILFFANGDVQFRALPGGTSITMNVGFDTGSMIGEWHQLTVKRDGSNNVFAQLDTGSWVTGSTVVSGNFEVEELADNSNLDQNFDGAFSNMLIYTSSLLDTDVSQIYNYYASNF